MSGKHAVLVVDDDEAVRESLSEVLAEEGYDVAAAENGAEALRYLADHGAPCAIVLDLMMPVMAGPEFRGRQLADPRFALVPVIVMSAADRGRKIATDLHAHAFFSKPPDMNLLLKELALHCPAR